MTKVRGANGRTYDIACYPAQQAEPRAVVVATPPPQVYVRPVYPKVVILPRYGGRLAMTEFFRPALYSDVAWVFCRDCTGPIDPAALTVEHPDVHPTCTTYPEDAPMDTPLPREEVAS